VNNGAIQDNRLVRSMAELRRGGRKAFVAYIMAGDPDLERSMRIVRALEDAGTTAVELGIPFSDPIADGPVIQAAANRALQGGVTLPAILDSVRALRATCDLPILLMGYWNVFLQYGHGRVAAAAKEAGADGFVIPDLPAEADPAFYTRARELGLATVLLASELTTPARLEAIARTTTGFLYYVPRIGITGLNLSVTQAIRERLVAIRKLTDQPICVGIGVKTREDVKLLEEVADGVIVGTRIVDLIHREGAEADLPTRVAGLARELIP
jgi:tryptophan synthase alpha chain